MSRVAGQ